MDKQPFMSLKKTAHRPGKASPSRVRLSETMRRLRRSSSTPDLSKVCSSPIFCTGKLLHTIQMSNLYKDSKTFVDMATRLSEQEVLSNFEKLGEEPSIDELKTFVNDNFHESGFDLVKVEPKDWHENPPFLHRITDERMSNFGRYLNCKWKMLLRNFDYTKIDEKSATTALCTKNSFIVPGGRFIEYYYWDTYWIVEGLLSSGMVHTTRGIIENFLEIVKKHGFVPNGSRAYYLNRSQPPLLTQMVEAYYRHTGDKKFLEETVGNLDTEYDFWMSRKAVKIVHKNQTFKLNVYKVKSSKPRPESYREDYHNAMLSENQEFYFSNIISATESGWDFSSRWFNDPMDIKTIQIVNMVPVDLNSIMFQNEKCLLEFHTILGNVKKVKFYSQALQRRLTAINTVLWNGELNTWGDYNLKTKRLNSDHLYISDLSPLWSGLEPPSNVDLILKRYKSLLFDHPSGIPASNVTTGQQWDYPNVWAPYHLWIVDYFRKNERVSEACDIARRLVNAVYTGWLKTNYIFEKYDAEKLGSYGGGGEYVVQEGFGWTNGCVIKFIEWFGNEIKLQDEQTTTLILDSIMEMNDTFKIDLDEEMILSSEGQVVSMLLKQNEQLQISQEVC